MEEAYNCMVSYSIDFPFILSMLIFLAHKHSASGSAIANLRSYVMNAVHFSCEPQ